MEIGAVFQVIFTVILMVALLIFGYYIVVTIMEQQEMSQLAQAMGELQSFVNDFWISYGIGSTKNYTMNIPASSKFCFLNPEDPSANLIGGWEPNNIEISMIIDEGYNLWVYFKGGADAMGKIINHLEVSDFGNFCADDRAILKMENLGQWVEVSPRN